MSLRSRSPLIVAVLLATAMGYYHQEIFLPHALAMHRAEGLSGGYFFGNDYYPIWLASREWMLHHRNPYSAEMTQAIQTGLFGRPLDPHNRSGPDSGYRTFSYPAFTDILNLPLAWLPFAAARIVMAVLLPLLATLAVLLWARWFHFQSGPHLWALVLLTLFSYPALEAVFALQWGLIVLFFLALSFAALGKGRMLLSGCLLALATIKPQLVAMPAVYLLLWTSADWRGRKSFAYGFLGVMTLLCTGAMLISPSWISQWVQVLFGYRRYTYPPLANDVFGPHLGWALTGLLLVAAVALAWRMRRLSAASEGFRLTTSLLLAISVVTLLAGDAVYDHLLLLPGVLFLIRFWRPLIAMSAVFKVMLSLAAAALLWPGVAACAVIAAGLVRPLGVWAIMLPVRTAASLPFIILALLALAMRDVILGRLTLKSE